MQTNPALLSLFVLFGITICFLNYFLGLGFLAGLAFQMYLKQRREE